MVWLNCISIVVSCFIWTLWQIPTTLSYFCVRQRHLELDHYIEIVDLVDLQKQLTSHHNFCLFFLQTKSVFKILHKFYLRVSHWSWLVVNGLWYERSRWNAAAVILPSCPAPPAWASAGPGSRKVLCTDSCWYCRYALSDVVEVRLTVSFCCGILAHSLL